MISDLKTDAHLDEEERRAGLRQALLFLPARYERILRQRWGLGCEPMTCAAIAAEFGLSKARIRQIEYRALEYLRRAYRRAKRMQS
jgi:RNA polymerase sigma factor (sigma-70 family)